MDVTALAELVRHALGAMTLSAELVVSRAGWCAASWFDAADIMTDVAVVASDITMTLADPSLMSG
jgi:hypothetical protein